MPDRAPYSVSQQAASVTSGSITGTTAASATSVFTLTRRCSYLKFVSTLNQAVVILRNGSFWTTLPAATSSFYPADITDIGSDGQYFDVGESFTAYATSATPTSGTLWGVGT